MEKARKAKEMLLYVYPPNKNIGYIVKSIKAIYLTDNGSMLSTIR
jgi:hypothetical protein